MASGPEHDIKQMNTLIAVTLDSAKGYADAANSAKGSRFATLFRERGAHRHQIVERLRTRVKDLGGEPAEHGAAIAGERRGFADLGRKMSGNDTSVIAEVKSAEDHVMEIYQKIVLDEELSDPVRAAIESEFAQIQANQDVTQTA